MKYLYQINNVTKCNTVPRGSYGFPMSFQPKGVDDNLAILYLDNHTISRVPNESRTRFETYVTLEKVKARFFYFSFFASKAHITKV